MSELEDVSFYDILGNEVSRENIVNEMITYYNQKLEVGETKVTDFNEGSEIRNLLESIAVEGYSIREDQYELSQIAFISTAYGEWLDLQGEHPLLNAPRDKGGESTGYVTFSIPEAVSYDIVINADTVIVSDDTGLEYSTDIDSIIFAGDTSATVAITCLTTGEEGNESAGKLTVIDDESVPDIVSVTNADALTGGTDYEEDEEYRERLLGIVQKDTFGSLAYYTSLGNSVDGVHDVLLVDDTDNQEPQYTKIVLVNGDSKPVSDAVLMEVLQVFTDTDNIVIGHNFGVDRPEEVTVNLSLDIGVTVEIDEEIITTFVNGIFNGGSYDGFEFDGLNIGEGLSKEVLYSGLSVIDYVATVTGYINGSTSEMTDITINENQILVLGNLNITQTIVEN